MLYELWKKAAAANPGKIVLVFDGEGSAVTFVKLVNLWAGVAHQAIHGNAISMTGRLNELELEWVLVNAPDDVAAACGVPVE